MSFKQKSDYIALQNLWYTCSDTYLKVHNADARMVIVDDFRDTLLDISQTGTKAIRSRYETWENEVWLPLCEKRLSRWMRDNPYESRIADNCEMELNNIKRDLNFMRYRTIMQYIQDSGIGLGQGRTIKTIERRGFNGNG